MQVTITGMFSSTKFGVTLAVFLSIGLSQVCSAQTVPDGATTESAEGLRLVAHDGLQARQTYQMVVNKQRDRWLLYAGHLRGTERDTQTGQVTAKGTSVLDVTDPTHPRFLIHIPPTSAPWFKGDPADATGAQHQQVCGNRLEIRSVARIATFS